MEHDGWATVHTLTEMTTATILNLCVECEVGTSTIKEHNTTAVT